LPAASSQPDFKNAAAPNGPSTLEIQRFFAAVSANDVKAVLPFVMTYPKEAGTLKSSEGLTALMFAAREGLKETAWLLIHAKCDLEIGNQNDSTALMFSAHSGKASICAMLLEAGAQVNHVNKNGHTPLMSAASQGFKNTVEQLLKYNADIAPSDEDGHTALDYAHENQFTEIEEMISTAAATPAAARAPEAAAAKAQAEAQNRPVISDDNGATLKDLEKRLIKAKLTYPGAKEDTGGDNGDKSVSEAREVLSNIQKKLDKDGPMF
jgi:hypothetical protein